MNSRKNFVIAIVITFGIAAGAIAIVKQAVSDNRPTTIDPSIPSITITAKRLTTEEKLQWLKEDFESTTGKIATEKLPAKHDTSTHLMPVTTRG